MTKSRLRCNMCSQSHWHKIVEGAFVSHVIDTCQIRERVITPIKKFAEWPWHELHQTRTQMHAKKNRMVEWWQKTWHMQHVHGRCSRQPGMVIRAFEISCHAMRKEQNGIVVSPERHWQPLESEWLGIGNLIGSQHVHNQTWHAYARPR